MKRLSIIIAFLIGLFQFASASVTKAEADKDYQENKFADAIEKYEAILASEGESADIYYNLGNSYYKNKNIAKAVLNYERALLMNPEMQIFVSIWKWQEVKQLIRLLLQVKFLL